MLTAGRLQVVNASYSRAPPLSFRRIGFTTFDRLIHLNDSRRLPKAMSNSEYLSFPHPRRCPTIAEVTFSKNLLYNLDQEINQIMKEVNTLQNQLQLLQAQLQPLQKRRHNHASYISSFRRLPVELIEIIVHICLKEGVELVVMTQICGSIRDIVNGMSDIWSSISLDPNVRFTYDHQVEFLPKTAIGCLAMLGSYFLFDHGAARLCSHGHGLKGAQS
jgi:hypothetical protein